MGTVVRSRISSTPRASGPGSTRLPLSPGARSSRGRRADQGAEMVHGLISGVTSGIGSGLEELGGALKGGGGGGGGPEFTGGGGEGGEGDSTRTIRSERVRRSRKDQSAEEMAGAVGGALETIGSGIKTAGGVAGNVVGGLLGEGAEGGGDSALPHAARHNAAKFPSPED